MEFVSSVIHSSNFVPVFNNLGWFLSILHWYEKHESMLWMSSSECVCCGSSCDLCNEKGKKMYLLFAC